jgi:hypothetical protein
MDLVTLAFTFLMQNPGKAVAGAQHLARPGAVDVAQMKESFADFSRGILNCYHRTARYQIAQVLQSPWTHQDQYRADKSALISIHYSGVSGAQYQMVVAVLAKGSAVRTAVINDTAAIRYSNKCQLEQWTSS